MIKLRTAALGLALLLTLQLGVLAGPTPKNPYDWIAIQPTYSILRAAVDASGLASTLKSTSLEATLFMPNNAAFSDFLTAVQNNVRASQKNKKYVYNRTKLLADPMLRTLLLNHAVSGKASQAKLLNGLQLTTLTGNTISVRVPAGTSKVQLADAWDRRATITSSGGTVGRTIVYAITAVLAPPSFTLIDGRPNPPAPPAPATALAPRNRFPPPTLAPPEQDQSMYDVLASRGFNLLLYIVNQVSRAAATNSALTDWRSLLKSTTASFTIFAPTDKGIKELIFALQPVLATAYFSDNDILDQTLGALIVKGAPATKLTNGQVLNPIGGQTITISIVGGKAAVYNKFMGTIVPGDRLPLTLPGFTAGSGTVAYAMGRGFLAYESEADLLAWGAAICALYPCGFSTWSNPGGGGGADCSCICPIEANCEAYCIVNGASCFNPADAI